MYKEKIIIPAGFSIAGARENNIETISNLTKGPNMLHRSPEEIRALLPNYIIALNDKKDFAGCLGVTFYGQDAELITLRVLEEYEKNGLAKVMIQCKLQYLLKHGFRVFALTTDDLAKGLFLPMGFIIVRPQLFSPKISEVCIKCPKNRIVNGKHECNEVAVLYIGK
jgi:N-acetylglutamate synthase-like GNAT family acetyltransferase